MVRTPASCLLRTQSCSCSHRWPMLAAILLQSCPGLLGQAGLQGVQDSPLGTSLPCTMGWAVCGPVVTHQSLRPSPTSGLAVAVGGEAGGGSPCMGARLLLPTQVQAKGGSGRLMPGGAQGGEGLRIASGALNTLPENCFP